MTWHLSHVSLRFTNISTRIMELKWMGLSSMSRIVLYNGQWCLFFIIYFLRSMPTGNHLPITMLLVWPYSVVLLLISTIYQLSLIFFFFYTTCILLFYIWRIIQYFTIRIIQFTSLSITHTRCTAAGTFYYKTLMVI
jgi:hypothetical protein